MPRILMFAAAAILASVGAYAHGNNDHIQGTVAQIADKAITIQLANKTTKTVTLAAGTVFEKSGKRAALADLHVGERVIIDVEKGKLEAREVRFGPPPSKKAAAAAKH